MKKTLTYMKPYGGVAAVGLFFKLIGSLAELFLPLILDYIIEEIVPMKDVAGMIFAGLIMLAFSLAALFGNIIANRFAAKASGNMTHDLRYDLFKKTSYLKCGQVDKFTLPSLVSRLTADTYYVNQAVARSLRLGVRAPILLTGGLIFSFLLDWRLACVLAACVPPVTIAVIIITKKSVPSYSAVQKKGDAAVRSMQENISGVRVIKALSATEFETEKFAAINRELTETEFKTNKITSLTNPLVTLILNLGLVGVIAVGALVGARGGTVLAFLSYFTIILNATLGISKIFVTLSRGVASAERIERVLETDEVMPTEDCEAGDEGYKIQFKGVGFSYNGKKNDLEDISFGVKKGQTVGIIGGTGSGKTTLINVLMRFYDVSEGAVFVDGRNVRSMQGGELRSRFGVAFQNDFLMASSVRDNVDYFRGLDDGEIKKALYCSCADDFVGGLEGGEDFVLAQKATNLSGGQKQRLLVARALAGNPQILVLDDSSSALDYSTDAELRKRLAEFYPDCTKFIVAQRVGTIRHADIILVLDEGRIVGRGTHEELMRNCADYRQLYSVQMGGDL